MINTFKPELAQVTPANPHTDGVAPSSDYSRTRNIALAIGPGIVGILIFLLLLTIEAGALISFAVMFFLFVPMSRAFYEKYASPCRSSSK